MDVDQECINKVKASVVVITKNWYHTFSLIKTNKV